MKDDRKKESRGRIPGFLDALVRRQSDRTFEEIEEDWKWIFHYSRRYKKAIFIYIVLGLAGTSLGLSASIMGKYLIDMITV